MPLIPRSELSARLERMRRITSSVLPQILSLIASIDSSEFPNWPVRTQDKFYHTLIETLYELPDAYEFLLAHFIRNPENLRAGVAQQLFKAFRQFPKDERVEDLAADVIARELDVFEQARSYWIAAKSSSFIRKVLHLTDAPQEFAGEIIEALRNRLELLRSVPPGLYSQREPRTTGATPIPRLPQASSFDSPDRRPAGESAPIAAVL